MAREIRKPRHHLVVAALAGRRIDASDESQKRFPLENVPAIRESLQALFAREKVKFLVCSAACGADLIALDVALALKIQCQVILPFDPQKFRETSVIDRPGDWGGLYDRVVDIVSAAGTLTILDSNTDDDTAYEAVTYRIVHDARAMTPLRPPLAIIVWEGNPRGTSDATAQFRKLTEKAGFSERTVLTC